MLISVKWQPNINKCQLLRVCIYSIIRGKGTTLKWWIRNSEETFYLIFPSQMEDIKIWSWVVQTHPGVVLLGAFAPTQLDQIIHPIWIRRKFTLNQTCWSNFLYLIKVREHGIWSVRMVSIWKIATKKYSSRTIASSQCLFLIFPFILRIIRWGKRRSLFPVDCRTKGR